MHTSDRSFLTPVHVVIRTNGRLAPEGTVCQSGESILQTIFREAR
jgi:hypothetical protein